MRMDAGVDTGPMLAQAREPIRPDDTTLTLGARLAELGARLMAETLPKVLRGEVMPVPQDDTLASLSPKIDKEDGRIDWSKPAVEIDRMLRAYTPWPGAFTFWNQSTLRVMYAVVSEERFGEPASRRVSEPAGRVIELDKNRVGVITGTGMLELREVQLAGRRVMPIEEFVRGHRAFIGSTLGNKVRLEI
jgi:methionyl-tRNA formyltransferase